MVHTSTIDKKVVRVSFVGTFEDEEMKKIYIV
jgi:hypothetical protein